PDDPDALVELCKREIKDNHVNVAIGLLNEGIKKFPDNPKVLYLVGDFLVKEKQARMAKEVLERAYHMDRQHKIIGLPTSLARLYLDLNLTRSVLLATVDLEKLPNYDRALRVRGVAYRRMHSYRQAAADLSRVFANDPTVVPLDVDLADSYFWLGEYKKALEPTLFMVALTCVPDIENPMAIEKLTRLLRKIPEKEIAPALEQAIKPIKDRRKLDVFYYQVGIALDKVNMTDLANQYYREAIEGDPELVGPYYRLGVNQEVFEKDYEAALSNYTKAHNLRPWDNEIGLAQIRLHDRMTNQASDISLKLKRFFNELGK
ncbi:MAG: hypothetical protein K8F91_09870, partial [Candidatus Obscuribacterales bacterium]|nr:hypothetical protein [Candidatus Obscuribacterales bacterium]